MMQRFYPGADVRLEQGPARQQRLDAGASRVVAAIVEPAESLDVYRQRSLGGELLDESREQRFECPASRRQQRVRVAALRHAFAIGSLGREPIAVEQDDFFEMVGEHSRRE